MNILVVDDERSIVDLCVKVLGRLGHDVSGLTDGEEALSKIAGSPIDLLVVDYKMPGLNGFEVIRRARSLHRGLRIVLITGHGTREVVGEAIDGGVNGILVKPFTPDELTQTITAALS
jgi:DNA-binding response OmpR family regulator